MYRVKFQRYAILLLLVCLAVFSGCGGGGSGPAPATETRPFLMGSTPFFASHNGSNVTMPDWRFENLDDRDLISLHVDDFWGVPWDYCDATACTNLPQPWIDQWQQLATAAKATGKRLYLAASPLGGRRTLAPKVLADGSTQADWNSNTDANGCYLFDSDSAADTFKAAYISYLKTIIDLVNPDYFSPGVEINMPFTICPAQKTAWIAWYNDVHTAIKAAYPQLVIFPTFQMEYMYGISTPEAACSNGTSEACFETRLNEALTIPGDRLAFSTYPAAWVYHAEFDYSFPRESLTKAAQITSRKIWIAETGWLSVPLLSSYAHGSSSACGSSIYPDTLDIPGIGSVNVANDTAQSDYISWLLDSADENNLEAVVWWLNRDYLDESVTGNALCPCVPTGNTTCLMLEDFYTVGGTTIEVLFRLFGNMALRHYDGSPRPGLTIWQTYLNRSYQP
ncbi:MAG: hypothetical protein P8Z77_01100 [Candidatus Thiodiazotropha sp.]